MPDPDDEDKNNWNTSLNKREGQNGQHTLERHSGWTDKQLVNRLNTQKISAASTYTDEATAQRVVNESIAQNRTTIQQWLSSGSKTRLELTYKGNQALGRGINSGEVSVGVRTDAKTVLKSNGKGGFDIITSYPIK